LPNNRVIFGDNNSKFLSHSACFDKYFEFLSIKNQITLKINKILSPTARLPDLGYACILGFCYLKIQYRRNLQKILTILNCKKRFQSKRLREVCKK